MIKHFYIFRHGETDLNALKKIQGQSCNNSLNENGRKQAEALAENLKDKHLELIVSSPLKRALETAEIVAQILKLPVKEEKYFTEGNFGTIEGKSYQEMSQNEKKLFAEWIKLETQSFDVCFKHGETKRQILNRVVDGLKKLAKSPYQNIGISTHSAVIRMVLLFLKRKQHTIPNAQPFHFIYDNGSFYLAEDEKMLLLSCCAPCSCAVIKQLAENKKDFTVVFYNPNIRPFEEYQKRRDENLRVCQLYNVPFIELEYDNELWCQTVKGLENEPERGKRCNLCFYIRLKRVMAYAKENKFTTVASVLGVSRYKNLNQVNAMADLAAREIGISYTEIEGRKNGMQDLRAELIQKLGLYNQTYCGCKPKTN